MDQIQIGKFIAKTRKAQNLIQRQLADALSISDKTVSKWECRKGFPEVSLMLPLCETLRITVNDLLSGEKVLEADYQRKAEERMMDLMKENEEHRKRITLSVICGIITIIAVCSLIVIASFIGLPTFIRILLIFFAIVTAAARIGTTCVLDVKAGYFECAHCNSFFVPTMNAYVKGCHTLTKRKLTCHECGETGWCKRHITRQTMIGFIEKFINRILTRPRLCKSSPKEYRVISLEKKSQKRGCCSNEQHPLFSFHFPLL